MATGGAGERLRILFGFKTIPFPLRADGLSVRYLPILRHLAGRCDIDLLVVDAGPEECGRLEGLRPYCRRILSLSDPRRARKTATMRAKTYARFLLPWTPPLSVVSHTGGFATREIVEKTRGERYDAVVWAGGDLLPHLLSALPRMSARRVVVDFIDSPYLWSVRSKSGLFGIAALDRYERWKTRRWERSVVERVDGTIYISHVDARAAFPAGAPMTGKRHVIPNGINPPDGQGAERAVLPSPNIGFLGNMGYFPNVEAVEWLYKEVFAPLRRVRPELNLVVIGRNPSRTIRELGREPGVTITGDVDDVWPYIRGIDVFLFPLLRGAGLKNKILEAMYAGRPVVTTVVGNEGIDAAEGRELALCRTPEEFRRTAMRLLDSPEERARIGESAAAFVDRGFSWAPILAKFEEILFGGRQGGSGA